MFLGSPVAAPAAAAAVPPPPLLLLQLLLLLCRYSLLRAFQKTQNEKQSVVPGCAPRRIADREAATAPQPHRSRSSSSSAAPAAPAVVGGIGEGGVGGGSTARLYLHNNHSSTTMRSREERPKQEW